MTVLLKTVCGASDFFRPGDEILSIDGKRVEDQLDLLFLMEGKRSARIEVRRKDGDVHSRQLGMSTFERARLVFEEMTFTSCRSNCTFCFVDQMPLGMRSTLYEKDDDYRLSFLFGNYITLNDVSRRDLKRIIELNLSPLYISVHTVDRKTREHLFGRVMRNDIIQVMERLARAGITMHTQVVLVPGVNDGEVLEHTVRELFRLYPFCRSVAVVPVGLTSHRKGLPSVRQVSEREARGLINWAKCKRREFSQQYAGEGFLYLSDEFYLMTGRKLPPESYYDHFPQLSNGVGMCRIFIQAIERDAARLQRRTYQRTAMSIITGVLGGRFLRRYIVPRIRNMLPWLDLHIIAVRNRLFGSEVGVSGLLSGSDIVETVRRRGGVSGCLVLPPNTVNHEGLLIDDLGLQDIQNELGVRVLVPDTTFLENRIIKGCRGGNG